jgi:hypothetical protein
MAEIIDEPKVESKKKISDKLNVINDGAFQFGSIDKTRSPNFKFQENNILDFSDKFISQADPLCSTQNRTHHPDTSN